MNVQGLLFNCKLGSDFKITSCDKTIYLHTSILSNYDIYYKNLFHGSFKKIKKKEVKKIKVYELIYKYIYSKKMLQDEITKLTGEEIKKLLKYCDKTLIIYNDNVLYKLIMNYLKIY